MQINRLFEIVYLLLDRKFTTAKELADRFEISKRTILRDIDTLSAAGIPIYTSRGKGGGIFILDNFVLNKTVISEEEQNQILFALQSLAATQRIETRDILSKLNALFDKQDSNWIEVVFSRWGQSSNDNAKFNLLKYAILNKKTVQFEYVSSNGENSKRKVTAVKADI